MTGQIIEIDSIQELWNLYYHPKVQGAYLMLPLRLDPLPRMQWELNLNKYYSECGCGAGSIGFRVAFVASTVINAVYYASTGSTTSSKIIFVTLGSIVVGSVWGKIIGVRMSRKKLKATIRTIEASWQ